MTLIKKFKRQVNGQFREMEVGFNEYLATSDGTISLKSILCDHYNLNADDVTMTADPNLTPNKIPTEEQTRRFADNVFYIEHDGIKLTVLSESADTFDLEHFVKVSEYASLIKNLKVDIILCISDDISQRLFKRITERRVTPEPRIDYIFIQPKYWNGSNLVAFDYFNGQPNQNSKMLTRLLKNKTKKKFHVISNAILLRDYLKNKFKLGNKALANFNDGKDAYNLPIFNIENKQLIIKIRYQQNGSRSKIQTSQDEIEKFELNIKSIFEGRKFIDNTTVHSDKDNFIPINDRKKHYKNKLNAYGCHAKIDDIKEVLKESGSAFVSAIEGYTQYDGCFRPVYRAGDFVEIYESLINKKKNKPAVNAITSKAS